jgi:hypothetical protein
MHENNLKSPDIGINNKVHQRFNTNRVQINLKKFFNSKSEKMSSGCKSVQINYPAARGPTGIRLKFCFSKL